MSRRTFWNTPLGAAASLAIALSAVLLFLAALPVTGPILAVTEARAKKRKRVAVVDWPCGRCAHPLGLEALARADAVFAAFVRTAFAVDGMPRARIVRDLDACCRRCDAGHRYHRATRTFALLPRAEFERVYADALVRVGAAA